MTLENNTRLHRGRVFMFSHLTREDLDKLTVFAQEQFPQKQKEEYSNEEIVYKNSGRAVVVMERFIGIGDDHIIITCFDNQTKNIDRFTAIFELACHRKLSDELAAKMKGFLKTYD